MNTNQARSYNCKDEELPVICGYAAFSLKRDLQDFTAYSPKFNQAYLTDFESKTATAAELVNPKSETAERKAITTRLYAQMSGMVDPVDRLKGYIKLAGANIPVSITDFGITSLRRKINSKDAEGVLQYLRLVEVNIQKYKVSLQAEGLTDDLIARFTDASAAIAADNEKQYEMLSARKELVQNNLHILNALYTQLTAICDIGKILYRKTAPEKVSEYTFTWLLKQVRIVPKAKPDSKKSSKKTLNATE